MLFFFSFTINEIIKLSHTYWVEYINYYYFYKKKYTYVCFFIHTVYTYINLYTP